MSSASLDRLLAILITLVGLTGLLGLRSGSVGWAWVFVAHGLVAGALTGAVVLKLRRSFPRALGPGRRVRLAVAILLASVAIAGLGAGYAWVAGGRLLRAGPWTLMSWHAIAGVLLVPLLAVHLMPRRWRLLRPGARTVANARARVVSRRALLAGTALGAVAVAAWSGAGLLDRVMGGERRFTGSRWLTSGGVPPTTTFFLDGLPALDPAAWRLRIHGRVARPLDIGLPDLAAFGTTDLVAVLDCTSGWAMQTTWRGVPLADVLAAAGPLPGAGRLDVRSSTGWGAALELGQVGGALLATGVAGQPLPAANGAPCRLVVPDRRGLDWVKWVSEIEVR